MLLEVRESRGKKRIRLFFFAWDLVECGGEVELGRDIPPGALLLLGILYDLAQVRLCLGYTTRRRELYRHPC